VELEEKHEGQRKAKAPKMGVDARQYERQFVDDEW
jgi:hypothetical protein